MQQCSGHGKPHTEQDQIGRKPRRFGGSATQPRDLRNRRGTCRLGALQPPGRSLERPSNAAPRGMTVLPEKSGRQNSAYRSGCHIRLYINRLLTRAFLSVHGKASTHRQSVIILCLAEKDCRDRNAGASPALMPARVAQGLSADFGRLPGRSSSTPIRVRIQ